MSNKVAMWSASELLTAYRRKTLSPVEVTEAVLRVPSAPRDQVLPVLDDFVRFLAGSAAG